MKRKLIAEFRQGSGPMEMNAIDYYENENGTITKHSWAMGGSSEKIVDTVPEEVSGYIRKAN